MHPSCSIGPFLTGLSDSHATFHIQCNKESLIQISGLSLVAQQANWCLALALKTILYFQAHQHDQLAAGTPCTLSESLPDAVTLLIFEEERTRQWLCHSAQSLHSEITPLYFLFVCVLSLSFCLSLSLTLHCSLYISLWFEAPRNTGTWSPLH